MMKVLNVKQSNEIKVMPILHYRYEEQCFDFLSKFGKFLPEKENIQWEDGSLWRAVTETVLITVETDEGTFRFRVEPGFILDYASIPTWLRGKRPWYLGFLVKFPDNDSQTMVVPSLIHDACFALRLFGDDKEAFKKANKLFQALCEYYMIKWEEFKGFKDERDKEKKIKKIERVCRWLYRGVASPIGWKIYNESRPHNEPKRVFLVGSE